MRYQLKNKIGVWLIYDTYTNSYPNVPPQEKYGLALKIWNELETKNELEEEKNDRTDIQDKK